MNFDYDTKWVSVNETQDVAHAKSIDVLEQELNDIKNSLEVLDQRCLMLTNLAKLYD